MARNEEKQQGRLNRLWLQKERDEGRLRDVHDRRPKLSTLNSASSVKKWIPSIKNEIEYYLQSQLSHYPERKIAEFQLRIEALEKEYKKYITKLRVLDPSCRHEPWTPRAYCKRRADTQDSPSLVKTRRSVESHLGSSHCTESENDQTCSLSHKTSKRQEPLSQMEAKHQPAVPVHTNPMWETSDSTCANQNQNQPLSFNHTKLAVATAAFRGQSVQRGPSQIQSLARVLVSGLPNLANTSVRQTLSTQSRDTANDDGSGTGSVKVESMEKSPGDPHILRMTEERTANVLGLDCYSSSAEEADT
ncbi:uncharacterized protein si:dkey-86e18.1 isoform X2 [Antennarius striatus]|uniref:uncharacterized protein si:dkey-86e18.1 isoform X2 n=1 Tax=Antennarius striatus TaxID=241820 RepID=UPI0035ADD62C